MPFLPHETASKTGWGAATRQSYTQALSIPQTSSVLSRQTSGVDIQLRDSISQSPIMRLFTFASLSFLVLLVSAQAPQTSGTNSAGLDGLLADLAELPSCVVCTIRKTCRWMQLTAM